jgi:hypothetical protein
MDPGGDVLRKHVTFANVMSIVAVFIALGGSAIALRTNSVGSRHIKDDAVKGRHIADGKVKGKDLKERAVGKRELEPAALDLFPFVKLGSREGGFCDPTSATFVSCSSLTFSTAWPSRALLFAGGGQAGSAGAQGTCKFRINASRELLDGAPPAFGDPEARSTPSGFGLTAVSDPAALVPPGSNTFEVVCNEVSGDVRFGSFSFSVLTVGGAGFG